MKFVLLVPILFAFHAQGIIEWEFQNSAAGYEDTKAHVFIGTPPQKLQLPITFGDYCPGVVVKKEGQHSFGGFDADASSTFVKIGNFTVDSSVNGITGLDNFIIKTPDGKNRTLLQKPFNIGDSGTCSGTNQLSLAYSEPKKPNDFMESLFAEEEERIVVLTLNEVPRNDFDSFSGTMHIGDWPSICSNWHTDYVIGTSSESKWEFNLQKVSAGKFAASNPGRANIVLDTTAFTLSFKVYDSVAKALGVNGKRQAPCNSTMDIIFRAADFDLHITPQDYLKPGAKDDELCDFLANDDSNIFSLPLGIFTRYCVMLDFEHKEIGFGNRK